MLHIDRRIHPTAVIDPRADIGFGVSIGPYSVIGPYVTVESNAFISSHVRIEGRTRICQGVRIDSFAAIGGEAQCTVLEHNDSKNALSIGARTIIREHSSVHVSRSTDGQTCIGEDCLIMGQVHMGHDCKIGDRVVISQGSGLAGFVTVEDDAIVGAMVGVHQNVRIGKFSMLGAKAGVDRDVLPFGSISGERAKLFGPNVVGLRRAGLTQQERSNIRKAINSLGRTTSLEKTCKDLLLFDDKNVDYLVGFVRNSKRGFVRSV